MKNLTLLFITLILFSCEKDKEKPAYVLFDGSVTNTDATVAVISGYDFTKQMPVTETGKFQDTLKIEKDGYYSLQVGRESSLIYLEKGGDLNVTLDASQFDESLKYTGTLAPENNYLAAKYMWNELNFDPKATFSKEEQDFIKDNDKMQQSYDSLLKSLDVKNENFITAEKNERNYIRASNLENYQNYHRYYTKNDTFKTSPAFYENLKGVSFTDTAAFRNSTSYQQMVASHYQRLSDSDLEKNDSLDASLAYLQKVNDNFPDGYAKQQLMRDRMTYGMTANNSLDKIYNLYKSTKPSVEDFQPITKRYNLLKTLQKGNPSPTFDYENYKGGKTALADLKGKYAYIDVWATWCGPCLAEIPSLKNVEEEFEGKNIQFVSISIDVEKDHDKWKKMIDEKDLGGIQLMADNNWQSKFVQDYAINGIPRFILIDAEGKIVSADAPRPSDPKLKTMLNNLL